MTEYSDTREKASETRHEKSGKPNNLLTFFNTSPLTIPILNSNDKKTTSLIENEYGQILSALEKNNSSSGIIGVSSSSEFTDRAIPAVLLGKALARSGKKILVIDADFDRPSLNMYTDVPCIYGLKDLLARHEPGTKFESESEIPGLAFLPSGTPDEKLRKRMQADFWTFTTNMFKLKYEIIILVLPELKTLGVFKDGILDMLFLAFLKNDSEKSIDEFFFARMSYKKLNFSSFIPIACQTSLADQ